MDLSISTGLRSINGAVGAPAAIGLDVLDAAYHTAHDFPGGVPALAQRMAVSHNTLTHKVGLNNFTHHLTLREAQTMMDVTGDVRVLHALAAPLGFVCVNLRADGAATTLEQVMNMAKEFGEVLVSVNVAVADGRVTHNEMQDCERQAAELMAALNGTLAAVRSMMPRRPDQDSSTQAKA